jgi:hypothetical protein
MELMEPTADRYSHSPIITITITTITITIITITIITITITIITITIIITTIIITIITITIITITITITITTSTRIQIALCHKLRPKGGGYCFGWAVYAPRGVWYMNLCGLYNPKRQYKFMAAYCPP